MTLVMNEGANTSACSSNTASNHLAELGNQQCNPTTLNDPVSDKKDLRPSKCDPMMNGLNLNMDKMFQNVDSKLDRLAAKVELLEKQITTLLKNLEIKNNETIGSAESSSKSSYQDLNVTNKAMLLNDLKYLDQTHLDVGKTGKNEKLTYINSPDSLLSSPILNTNTAGSCLLFNDLY